ncbi:MAG TPA: serine hydrolase domain-containing protein [Rhodocyclaceae bacterium]|nr:serine hydrolase domain-containing protein [Rhodocyclaceae bacterium]
MLATVATFANRQIAASSLLRPLLRTLPVPHDLARVTDIDRNAEVEENAVGLPKGTVDAIWQAAENLYCTGFYPAIMLCLRRRGKIVMNRAIGYASGYLDESTGKPGKTPVNVTTNTPACIYSASKAITAMAIHKLAEQRKIDLLDPVAHYIPEFAARGKERLNIYQILSHRGGVPGIPVDEPAETVADHARMLELICAAEPLCSHGRAQAYHALTGGPILQEIIERVTGQPLRNYWREHFKQPMGFRFLDYGATPEDFALMARDYICGAKLPGAINRYLKEFLAIDAGKDAHLLNRYQFFVDPIAAGNMVGTAEELSRFFQMLLDNGRYEDKQIVAPLTVQHATLENSPHRIDGVLKIPLRFSAGMMMGGERFGLYGRRTERAFGHLGLVNILGWADPERDISVGLLTTGKPLLAHNLPFFALLVEAISGKMPRDGVQRRSR